MNGELRRIIMERKELTLIKLTKGGMALLSDEDGKFYSVPPSNVREVEYLDYLKSKKH